MYQLAAMLGYASPSKMLREMTRREWLEWQVFLSLEPLAGPRMDVHNAAIIREIRNFSRDPQRHPAPFTLEECLIRFGDDLPPGPTRKQDWREQKQQFLRFVQERVKPST